VHGGSGFLIYRVDAVVERELAPKGHELFQPVSSVVFYLHVEVVADHHSGSVNRIA